MAGKTNRVHINASNNKLANKPYHKLLEERKNQRNNMINGSFSKKTATKKYTKVRSK